MPLGRDGEAASRCCLCRPLTRLPAGRLTVRHHLAERRASPRCALNEEGGAVLDALGDTLCEPEEDDGDEHERQMMSSSAGEQERREVEGELDGSGEDAEAAAGAEEGVAVGACAGDADETGERGWTWE